LTASIAADLRAAQALDRSSALDRSISVVMRSTIIDRRATKF
jgi:hypothetical protein